MTKPASGIFTKVLQVQETTFNTLPVSPTMTDVPFTDCSLALDITNVVDNSIQGDGMHRHVLPTTQKVAGTISGEVTHKNLDWIFQGMFYNQFSSNVLVSGVTQNTFSIEVGATDISQYFLYTGCVIDKLQLTAAPAGIITYKADFIGAGSTIGTTTNATTTANANAAAPMTTVTATIKEGGNVVALITGGTFSFDRKHAVNYALGNAVPVSLSTSFFEVTGTLDVFLEDEVLYNKFVNGSNSSLDWTFTDSSNNTYELVVPNLSYTTATNTIKDTGPIELKMNFTGVFDPTTGTNCKVVRSS
jgi:Phage tail tube protein